MHKGQLMFSTLVRFYTRLAESRGRAKTLFAKTFVKTIFGLDRSPAFAY
jgi:hypothetical protein